MQQVVIISGPTAAGKTAKSIDMARKLEAEIISCDSVQVYKHMDIGSAKVDAETMREIPHHLIDVCEPSRQFSVGEYVELAREKLRDIARRGRCAVVVGGSGFYLRAWFAPVSDNIEIPEKIKNFCLKLNFEEQVNKLLELDSEAAEFVDIKNPRRVRPALERMLASGLSLRELSEKFAKLPCPMGEIEREFIMVDLPDEEIFANAQRRAKEMLDRGLVEETRKLIELGFEKNPSAANSIGYRETLEAIKSGDFSDLEEKICLSTKQLIKKQRKFFKNALFKNTNYAKA